MGMCTTMVLDLTLSKETPQILIDLIEYFEKGLEYKWSQRPKLGEFEDHPFFNGNAR